MVTSQTGIDLIKRYEGLRLISYMDAVGVLTIGYGHTGSDVKAGQHITAEQAEKLLKRDLQKFEFKVNKYDSIYKWTQNEFDALVSFAYNIGGIEQLTNNGKRTKDQIGRKITAYTFAGGVQLKGLVTRRLAEQHLYLSKDNISTTEDVEYKEPTRNIKLKSKGDGVKWLQASLNKCGYKLVVDGVFGTNTNKAVIDFQKNHGLDQDGIVGKLTRAKIKECMK